MQFTLSANLLHYDDKKTRLVLVGEIRTFKRFSVSNFVFNL